MSPTHTRDLGESGLGLWWWPIAILVAALAPPALWICAVGGVLLAAATTYNPKRPVPFGATIALSIGRVIPMSTAEPGLRNCRVSDWQPTLVARRLSSCFSGHS